MVPGKETVTWEKRIQDPVMETDTQKYVLRLG